MSCSDCNGNTTNRCDNPCNVTTTNTAACESLPSQIENFTLQFFGEVVKTETDGVVSWSLPCSLDVGLINNPRGADEGLACYFLRLFQDGIIGFTGPQGDTGANGTNGFNAYTVTLHSFAQPSLGAPNVSVVTQPNSAILVGIYVFIATSGWYLVNAVAPDGTLFLSLVKALASAPINVTAGKLVVPSGFPGNSIVGPTGPQGPAGPAGPQSPAFTENNGLYFANIGNDYSLQIVYSAVTFLNSSPQILLTAIGTYLVTVVADIFGFTGVATSDVASLKLKNLSIAADVDGSEHAVSHIADGQDSQIVINTLVTTAQVNQTIALMGKCTSADVILVDALRTTVTFVRVS